MIAQPLNEHEELALLREAYGIVLSLATRPISRGNRMALHDGLRRLDEVVQALAQDPVPPHGTRPAVRLLDRLTQVMASTPPSVMARTLVVPLRELLAGWDAPWSGPMCYETVPTPARGCSSVIVAVGPTIGIGDEFLLARALLERAEALPGTTLRVSTRQPGLWRSGSVEVIGPPPLGAIRHLEAAAPTSLAQTAVLFVDFLNSDPTVHPYSGPPGPQYAGRWIMGDASGWMSDLVTGTHHRLRYPEGMPASRWLESRWAAVSLLPGPARPPAVPHDPRRASGTSAIVSTEPRRVVLQVLTSKPALLFPPTYWASVFGLLAERHTRFVVELLRPAAEDERLIVETTAKALADELGSDRVLVHDMDEVSPGDWLAAADLVVGPDTFVAHLAAAARVPQVVVGLPQHGAWHSTSSPSLVVDGSAGDGVVLRDIVQAADLLFRPGSEAPEALRRFAPDWAATLAVLDHQVLRRLWGDGGGGSAELGALDRIHEEVTSSAEAWLHPLPSYSRSVTRDDPAEYSSSGDQLRAVSRGYHHYASSNLSGLLLALEHAA